MELNFLRLCGYSIYEQLLLEESLLRMDQRNWCIINQGSTPAIVMGISGKKEELIDCPRVAQDQIPLIRRFSGGGTVIVDEDTLFITFIFQKDTHPFPAYPEPILRWHEELYKEAFEQDHFHLIENDFVIADKKCGGNAQYIKKDRWLHHTSFLWDYTLENMSYLLLPKKTPQYRHKRSHTDFLCRLCEYFPSKTTLLDKIKETLEKRYTLLHHCLTDVCARLSPLKRQTTILLDPLLP